MEERDKESMGSRRTQSNDDEVRADEVDVKLGVFIYLRGLPPRQKLFVAAHGFLVLRGVPRPVPSTSPEGVRRQSAAVVFRRDGLLELQCDTGIDTDTSTIYRDFLV